MDRLPPLDLGLHAEDLIGVFELFGAAVAAAGESVDFLVQAQSNPCVDRWLEDARKRLGVGLIRRGAETPSAKLAALAALQRNAGRIGLDESDLRSVQARFGDLGWG